MKKLDKIKKKHKKIIQKEKKCLKLMRGLNNLILGIMSESAKVSFRLILVFLAVFCVILVIASQASTGLW